MSALTGARRNTSSPTASEMALSTAQAPAATGGSPMPLAPTGVSRTRPVLPPTSSIFVGTSRIVGGLF